MCKLLVLLYGIFSYAIGLGGLTAFMLYMGGWSFLPFSIHNPLPAGGDSAFTINLLLLVAFAVHHSVTARESFKRRLTKIIPRSAERPTYVLISGLFMLAFCVYWQPIGGGVVWSVGNSLAATILMTMHIVGWLILVAATFEIDHFELMGLKQAVTFSQGKEFVPPKFKEKILYRLVRHPIQLGILMGMWINSTMTVTHLMLSVGFTVYVFIGLYFEEKSLIAQFGDVYRDYKKRVPMVLPFPRPRS